VRPENTVGFIGKTVKLNCRGFTSKIEWIFTATGSHSPITIAQNCKLDKRAIDHHKLDTEANSCNLEIEHLTFALAGSYTCSDRSERSSVSTAQLVILEADPTCSPSTGNERSVAAGTDVILTCSVRYAGLYPPVMEWIDEFDTVHPDSTTATKEDVVESSITVTADGKSVQPHTCKTYFDDRVTNGAMSDEKSFVFEAKNVFYYEQSWTSLPLRVTAA